MIPQTAAGSRSPATSHGTASDGKEGRVIKLHLFSGFEKASMGITPDTELGHLYDDANDAALLADVARELGMRRQRIQVSRAGLFHFDLWGHPLEKAKGLFPVVPGREVARDMQRLASRA